MMQSQELASFSNPRANQFSNGVNPQNFNPTLSSVSSVNGAIPEVKTIGTITKVQTTSTPNP